MKLVLWMAALFTALLISFTAFALDIKPYVREDTASDVVHLDETLRKESAANGAKLKGKSAADLLKAGASSLDSNDYKGARFWFGAAVAADPKAYANWLGLARLGVAADDAQASDRWEIVETATTAAYAAYLHANGAEEQAQALAVLANLFARHENWRPALDAYVASLQRHDSEDVRKTYEQMRAEHGFRIVDYKVDNESATPRICFNFSESLAHKTDFAPYIAVAGASTSSISVDDQQICVEGLKHGERYAIVLRAGLPSAVGESLLKAADYEIYVRDRSPQAHFAAKAYVLPRQGQLGAPLTTVNASKVAVDIYRVGDRNLISAIARDDFLKPITGDRAREIQDQDGAKVWSGAMDIASELNKEVVTDFPLTAAIGKLQPGVYLLAAQPWKGPDAPRIDDTYDQVATQWMVVSDIGLSALTGDNGIIVIARSLATAEPLAGVEVRLIARNNEILATLTTGADGRASFDPGLARGTGGQAPGAIVAALADDYNFLSLTQAPFDLTDRGVAGRDAPKALDAFIYTERGVYRSGETVFSAAVLRDAKGEAKGGLPLTLVVKRPDGVEYKRSLVKDQGLGGRGYAIPLVAGVTPGTWTIQAYVDPKADAVGSASFLVEDYVPERLDFTLKSDAKFATKGEQIPISFDARFLYGAPASGLDVTGATRLKAVPDAALDGYPGFVAGMTDDEFTATEAQFPDKYQTDAKGHGELLVDLPDADAPRPLQAQVIVDVAEAGGRTVERVLTLPVRAKGPQIGVKQDFDESLGEGEPATFETIAVSPDGQRIPMKGVSWSLYQLFDDYQWYLSEGRWNYEPVKSSKRLASGTVDIAGDEPAKISAPAAWGRHRLDLKSADGQQTSITFDVGWGGSASADTPDNVVVTLDKSAYAAGDKAKLRIASKSKGKATIALVGDRIEKMIDVDLVVGDNVVDFDVGGDWGSGAYAVALTHRPLDVTQKRMPGRAIGVAWFRIDEAGRKLDLSISAPETTSPRQNLKLPIKIGGLQPNEEAYVTVAAVDLGILNLTHFKSPDPTAYFNGQRKLPLDIRDLYGLLIDGMEGVAGAIRSGGDGGGALEGNLPTQEPLALYSGVVKVGADGVADIAFDIPGFNGSAKVMAVAWSKSKVGSAEATVIIRDPVVVTASLPRFLDLGDRSTLHIDIDNVAGEAGDYRIDLDLDGPVAADASDLSRTIKLAAHQRASVIMPIRAVGVGTAALDIATTGPGFNGSQHFALGVKSGSPTLISRKVDPLQAGATLAIEDSLVAPFIANTGSISVSVSPFGALDASALLQSLSRYPYGCSEQTVSRAMPLLYVNNLASLEHLAIDPDLDKRVRAAIDVEMSRQNSSGAFGLWAIDNDGDDLWLDAFVTDFLTRARERNFDVPAPGFASALDHLRNTALNSTDAKESDEGIAYALYVLARNGRPIIGDLRYTADDKLDTFKTPMAKAQIGAALALLGDRGRAAKTFSAALKALEAEKDDGYSRQDYGSKLRDAAAVLALLAEANLSAAELPGDPIERAGDILDPARDVRSYVSTQEMNWMTLAAEALAAQKTLGSITVDGQPVNGSYFRNWKTNALGRTLASIANVGSTSARVTVSLSGALAEAAPAASQGYVVERSFYHLDGTKADLSKLMQNERVVVALKITESEARYARLLVVDPLPAGLEINNPTLFDSGSVEALSWLKRDIDPIHSEYRDDRFVAAMDRDTGQSAFFTLSYVARAVVPGHYVYPPATAEDMYNPERFGRTSFNEVEVKSR
jgi:alpha-2-macroglobulin